MKDFRGTTDYAATEEHFRRLHEPAFGIPHALSDIHLTQGAVSPLVTGFVFDQVEGLPRSAVYLVEGDQFHLVSGPGRSARNGRYAPDGHRFAYLSDHELPGHFQLYLGTTKDHRAGSAAQRVDGTVEYLHWSPDGRHILLGVADLGADLSSREGSGDNRTAAKKVPDWYPEVAVGGIENAWRSLWVYSIEDRTASQVSPTGLNCWEAQWCGPELLVAVTSDRPSEDDWYGAVVSTIDIDSATATELFASDVQLALPGGSTNGQYASVVQAVCSDRGIVAGELVVLDLETGAQTVVDTAQTDITFTQWIDEHHLGYFGLRGLETVVGTFDAAADRVTELHRTPLSCGSWYPSGSFASSTTFAMIEDSYTIPPQVTVRSEGASDVIASISHPGVDYLQSICGTADVVSWQAPDGLEIQGVLCTPDGDGPFPLVVNIHGGPVWCSQNTWSMNDAWVPLLVSRGYAVLSPNPRGSGGRGQAFARLVVGDMGGDDTHDHLSGIDALVEQEIADPSRIGLIGRSYGGYMSSWLVTQDTRFAAAVSVSPVTDWYSQSFTSNIAAWGSAFLGADPEMPGSKAHTRSPVLRASTVETPCLNVAGARDRCTPPTQAQEFHQALTAHGVDSALVIYPHEGHGVRSFPAIVDLLARVTSWFTTYMPPDGISPAAEQGPGTPVVELSR